MRISNYPTDTLTGDELILATDVNTSTQEYKTVNFSVDTLKTFLVGTDDTYEFTNITLGGSLKFEGATADAYETTLGVVDPTADRVINLPNVAGTLPVLAVASTTAITSTPEEINYLDITTLGTSQASKAVTADANGVVKITGAIKYGAGGTSPTRVDLQSAQAITFNENQGVLMFDSPDAGIADGALSAEITFTNNKILNGSAVIIAHIGASTAPCEILVYGIATGSCKMKILNKSGGAIADGTDININFSVINTN